MTQKTMQNWGGGMSAHLLNFVCTYHSTLTCPIWYAWVYMGQDLTLGTKCYEQLILILILYYNILYYIILIFICEKNKSDMFLNI